MIDTNIGNDWDDVLSNLFKEDKVKRLLEFINDEYEHERIYPPREDIFNAFKLTPFNDIRVVILGQDPYIRPNQAQGLSFSVPVGEQIPPSLLNVFKELHDEMGCYIPNNGCLIPWAKQGVLLLNSVLTVRENKSGSHANKGWEYFTDEIIKLINQKDELLCFMLWGNYAKQKAIWINPYKHMILKAAHPSPLAGGAFFGCNHFIKCNEMMYEVYPNTIDWQIPNIEHS